MDRERFIEDRVHPLQEDARDHGRMALSVLRIPRYRISPRSADAGTVRRAWRVGTMDVRGQPSGAGTTTTTSARK